MSISIKSNKVLDLKKRVIRDIEQEDKFSIHLDVEYLSGIKCSEIDDYLSEICHDDKEKNSIVKAIGYAFNPTNRMTVLYGKSENLGTKSCLSLIEKIFGEHCLRLKGQMFKKGTIRKDLDLYCFKTHKVFIVEDFKDWDQLDVHFIKSIMNFSKMTVKKPKHACEGCVPECTIFFASSAPPDNHSDIFHTVKMSDVLDEKKYYSIIENPDNFFTYMANYLISRPKLEKKMSKSARLTSTISSMFLDSKQNRLN